MVTVSRPPVVAVVTVSRPPVVVVVTVVGHITKATVVVVTELEARVSTVSFVPFATELAEESVIKVVVVIDIVESVVKCVAVKHLLFRFE